MSVYVVIDCDGEANFERYCDDISDDFTLLMSRDASLELRRQTLTSLIEKWEAYLAEYANGLDFSLQVFTDLAEVMYFFEYNGCVPLVYDSLTWIEGFQYDSLKKGQRDFLGTTLLGPFAEDPRSEWQDEWFCKCLQRPELNWIPFLAFGCTDECIREFYKLACEKFGSFRFPETDLQEFMASEF